MRIELWVILIGGLLCYDYYKNRQYTAFILSYAMYYKVIGIVFVIISVIMYIRAHPHEGLEMLEYSKSFAYKRKVNRSDGRTRMSVLDLTLGEGFMSGLNDIKHGPRQIASSSSNEPRITAVPVKRAVSETKKKYIASNQNWKCGKCKDQLDHTFEIDHKVRLEYGGTNDVENLIALCRNCHGKKTALENM